MKTYLIPCVILVCFAGVFVSCGQEQKPPAATPANPPPADKTAAQTPISVEVPSANAAAKEAPADAAQAAQTLPAAAAAPDQVPGAEPAAADMPPAPPLTPLPDVLAHVGDKDVTKQDFEREAAMRIRQVEMRTGQPQQPNDEINAIILKNVIEAEVLAALAQRAGTTVTDDEVNKEFQESKKQLPSEEEYQAYLQRENITEPQLLEMMKKSMTLTKFIESVAGDQPASDEEVKQEYERLLAQGVLERKQETSDVRHILIKVDSGADQAAWDEGKKRIDAARARIAAGEKFEDVAKEVTEDPGSKENGGAYRDVPPGQMVPEFDQMMAGTPAGQVSEPFKTNYGWHILTVTAKHPVGTVAIEDVKEDIQQSLAEKTRRDTIKKTIEDGKTSLGVQVFHLKDSVFPPPAPPPAADSAPASPEGQANAAPTPPPSEPKPQ